MLLNTSHSYSLLLAISTLYNRQQPIAHRCEHHVSGRRVDAYIDSARHLCLECVARACEDRGARPLLLRERGECTHEGQQRDLPRLVAAGGTQ